MNNYERINNMSIEQFAEWFITSDMFDRYLNYILFDYNSHPLSFGRLSSDEQKAVRTDWVINELEGEANNE